jgi:serpin B
MRRLLPLCALSLLCAACDPPAPPAPPASSAGPQPSQASRAGGAPSLTAAPEPAKPVSTAAAKALPAGELKALAAGNNAFAIDLYARARSRKGNLALSPFSISTALTMTWGGARGETAAQMKKVLHADGTPERAADAAGKLIAGYAAADQKVTLRVANRLFGEKSYAFDPGYVERTRAAFGAPLEPLDFKGAAEAARQHINAWVAGETRNRITDLIPPDGVNAMTRLVLANAIYFLGDWMQPFAKEATAPAPFWTSKSDQKDVPTMRQSASLRFAAAGGAKVVELPYQGGDLAMTFVLPDARDGLDAVEAGLTHAVLDGWTGALAFKQVDVWIPRIEINPTEPLSLGSILAAMGMPLAFDEGKADFTGIANPASPADRLFISRAFHKAFVKVDEKGTEAAAASAVVMQPESAHFPAEPPMEFHADHPFLFFLRDLRSGMILFMGRVNDPAAK